MIQFYKRTEISLDSKAIYSNIENFNEGVSNYFIENFNYSNFFLTKSCTQSLELAIMSLRFPYGKEVILPSYGFISIANAVAINGLKCVFVDCEPGTMNINTNEVLNAITKDTVAIITINYAGVACDYDELIPICKENNIIIIEDNAHGIRAKYKDIWLGKLGDISTISFDFLKNISCDEGGGMSLNNTSLLSNFEVAFHFGTNKANFLRGEVDAYEWKGIGSNSKLANYLSEILYDQLANSELIIKEFVIKWQFYFDSLKPLQNLGFIELAKIPNYSTINGHMFWIKVSNSVERSNLISFLKQHNIITAFHYTPLHNSEYGKKVGEFRGMDKYTTKDSSRLLRLPIYFSLTESEQSEVISKIYQFYNKSI